MLKRIEYKKKRISIGEMKIIKEMSGLILDNKIRNCHVKLNSGMISEVEKVRR